MPVLPLAVTRLMYGFIGAAIFRGGEAIFSSMVKDEETDAKETSEDSSKSEPDTSKKKK